MGEATDLSAQHPEIVERLTTMAESYQRKFSGGLRKAGYVDEISEEFEEIIAAEAEKKKIESLRINERLLSRSMGANEYEN